MSRKLISHSPDLTRLREEGYHIEIRGGYLLVKDVPYVNADKQVRRGVLVAKLELTGDATSQPKTHVVQFAGDYPCWADGAPIEQIRNASNTQTLAEGVAIDHSFSAKPQPSGKYDDYYAQMTTYCSILAGPAAVIDPSATPKTFAPVAPDADDEGYPFHYLDTASSRAEIGVLAARLALKQIAIIGLGGTGAYVLDLVAKTPVGKIHLYDGDFFFTHNAFRAPGAASLDDLRTKPRKVDYLAAIYSKMHRSIVPHPVPIDRDNVDDLRPMDFVFLCLDDGPAKRLIVEKLGEFGIAFIDAGMGIYMGENGLGGTLRVTASTPQRRDHVASRISFAAANDANEYGRNIQIADLNALNAAYAVIKWKKLFGFYMDFAQEHHSTYSVEVQLLTKAEEAA